MTPILVSFHYFRSANLTGLVDELGGTDAIDLFVDSGAFSALNAGAKVTVPEYAEWLNKHHRVVNFAAGLDVIGDPKATAKNARALVKATKGRVTIVPTFHVGSDWRHLVALCKEYQFVALGGAVGVNRRERAMLAWLAHAHKIIRDAGAVAHGFGLTRPPYPEALPWFSVDSSYWAVAQRTGTMALWDRRAKRFVPIRVGRPDTAKHAVLLKEYGLDPIHFSTVGFGRSSKRGPDAKGDRAALATASVKSWRRYARHLRAARDVEPPKGVRGSGPKVYLAAGSPGDVRLLATMEDE